MLHQPYPNLQIECVTTLIDIGRRGAIVEEKREFAKCGYDLAGAVLKITVGEPDDVIVGSSEGELQALDSLSLEQLEEARTVLAKGSEVLSTETFGDSEPADPTAPQIDPVTVALIVQLAIKALEYFMSRKKGG